MNATGKSTVTLAVTETVNVRWVSAIQIKQRTQAAIEMSNNYVLEITISTRFFFWKF